MKEKKQSKDWYIAATHWLTSGFAIPFLMTLIIGIPLVILIGEKNIIPLVIASQIVYFFSIWLGIIYSSKYITKTYIVNDKDKIANLSTIYLIVLGGGFRIYNLLTKGMDIEFIINACGFVVVVLIFHILSKKYLRNTESKTSVI
jgi:hypothetical protein